MTEEAAMNEANEPLRPDGSRHLLDRIDELESLLAVAQGDLARKEQIIADWKKIYPLTTYLKAFDEREQRREAILVNLIGRMDRAKDVRASGSRRMRGLLRKAFPRQKSLPPFHERSMEDHITRPVALVAVLVTLALLLACLALYCFFGKREVVIEYASYAMPFLGALIAGLTVFCDKHKGKLFFLALFCLFVGLDAWIAIKPAPAIVIVVANGIMTIAILVWFFTIVVRSICSRFKSATSASNKKLQRWLGVATYGLAGVLTTGFMLFLLAACLGYYFRVYPCIQPYDPKLGSSDLSACPRDVSPHLGDAAVWKWTWPQAWTDIPLKASAGLDTGQKSREASKKLR
jgi:hypothetical protein